MSESAEAWKRGSCLRKIYSGNNSIVGEGGQNIQAMRSGRDDCYDAC